MNKAVAFFLVSNFLTVASFADEPVLTNDQLDIAGVYGPQILVNKAGILNSPNGGAPTTPKLGTYVFDEGTKMSYQFNMNESAGVSSVASIRVLDGVTEGRATRFDSQNKAESTTICWHIDEYKKASCFTLNQLSCNELKKAVEAGQIFEFAKKISGKDSYRTEQLRNERILFGSKLPNKPSNFLGDSPDYSTTVKTDTLKEDDGGEKIKELTDVCKKIQGEGNVRVQRAKNANTNSR